jgi:tetratricopeptide (TPR) repeat protein
MAANAESIHRQVVPRWRPFREALAMNELASGGVAQSPGIDGSEFLKEREKDWLESKAMPFAVDLVSAATVLGKTETSSKAAEFILENGDHATETARRLARGLLGIKEAQSFVSAQQTRMQIIQGAKELKAKRISQPRNAFVWADLARLYVLLGQNEPARKALNVALKLAPTERFVLRCSARFLHHIKEHEEALDLLRNNSRTSYDPWLMAAEIAAAAVAEKTPRFAKIGRQFLNKSDVGPFHTSELASALASLEMGAGSNRNANKLFRLSMKQPTDNALAQAVWASKRTGLGQVNPEVLEEARATEALTLNEFNQGNWEKVISHADRWAQEEGFSARPPLVASTTASSFLDKHELAGAIAQRGLETNPGHPLLINNAAFAQILQGKPQKALFMLAALWAADSNSFKKTERICLLATTGLACFRLGNQKQGRKYYEMAIEAANGPDNEVLRTVAALYLAREESLRGQKEAFRDFKRAYEAAQKLQQTHVPALAKHLARDVELAAARVGVQFEIRNKHEPFVGKGLFWPEKPKNS